MVASRDRTRGKVISVRNACFSAVMKSPVLCDVVGMKCPSLPARSDGICFALEQSWAIPSDGRGRLITQG